MAINYKISLVIIITATLHTLGFAAYIFDLIPVSIQKYYFYNLDRIYILLLLGSFLYLSINKMLKLALGTSLSIHLITTIIINIKYFVNLNNETREYIWILALSLSMIICLIVMYYVSRRSSFK